MLTLSQLQPLPQYFDKYMLLNNDVTVIEALQQSMAALQNAPIATWQLIGTKVYAPNKWTVNDILQHIIDTERVFAYRATAFARGEKIVQPFDENNYAVQANANSRTLQSLIDEAICLRQSTIHLYQSFTPAMLSCTGIGFKGEYSVHAIGYIIAGHQLWHTQVIENKYFSLV